MHILLMNEYYPPDTAATAKMAARVAGKLAEQHRVTVLAGRPSYDPTERHPFYLSRRDVKGNIVVVRVGSTTFPRFRMSRRLINYFSYLGLAMPRALFKPGDVILAMTDPPVAGIAAALVAMLRGRPLLYNIRDLYPDMAVAGGILRSGFWANVWEKAHCWALRRATRVIVLGEDMRDRIIAKGVDPRRVVIIRDGAPISETMASPNHPVVQEIRGGFSFVVLHAGNLGFYGAWGTLVKAGQLMQNEGIGLVFVGDGALRGKLETAVGECPTIRFLPFRPVSEVPFVLAAGDLHVVTLRRGLEGVVVPSKLYPILAAGRPLLAVVPEESDVARIVRRTGCGVIANPDDPYSVVEAVERLHGDRDRLSWMGKRAREVAWEYDQTGQLHLYSCLIDELKQGRPMEPNMTRA